MTAISRPSSSGRHARQPTRLSPGVSGRGAEDMNALHAVFHAHATPATLVVPYRDVPADQTQTIAMLVMRSLHRLPRANNRLPAWLRNDDLHNVGACIRRKVVRISHL